MSIILKALKKAEESKPAQKPVSRFGVFRGGGTNRAGAVIAAAATFAVALLFGVYIFKDGKPPELKAKNDAGTGSPARIDTQKPIAGREALSVEPASNTGLYEEGLRAFNEKNYSEAEKLLKEAAAKGPKPEVYNLLGLVRKKQSRLKDAVSSYEKALKLKPGYFEAMNNLAVALEGLGKKAEAERLYKKALSINPSYGEAHLNYALLLESAGRAKEAEAHYRAFVDHGGDAELKRLALGRIR